jgi:EF-P beta-lysylation protein EpmB
LNPPRRWQDALKVAIRDPHQLCQALDLPEHYVEAASRASQLFPLVVPWEFVARMRPGDPADPLLRQVLPLDVEQSAVPGFDPDPVAEKSATLVPGLLQKYAGRALMVTTPTCAVHCRYCFRRHFDYDSTPRALAAWSPAFDRLAADPTIEEVLLSGGDPLTLPDARLSDLVRHLESIPHLRRLRIHTRLPVVIPQRVTTDLLTLLRTTRLTTLVVIHANHPAELDTAVADSVARLVDSGIMVLNQSVLLRHVNDSTEVLAALSRRLLDLRVLPYYLHQMDAVVGAAHFQVPPERGEQLIAALRSELPGYAVPRYVREVPGEPSKVVLA